MCLYFYDRKIRYKSIMTIPVKNYFWRENYFMAGSLNFWREIGKKTKKIYIYKKSSKLFFIILNLYEKVLILKNYPKFDFCLLKLELIFEIFLHFNFSEKLS